MSVAETPGVSGRAEQVETSRLAWAFAISMAVHLLLFGGYYTDHRFHWTQYVHLPGWLRPLQNLAQLLHKKPLPPPPPPSEEVPLMFVDVNPAHATAEPPKNAKYYSSKNSQAANPDIDKESDVPKISGTHTEIVKTEDVPREKFMPLQPTPPVRQPQRAQAAQEPQAEQAQAKPAQKPGDLSISKPEPESKKEATEAKHFRPRLLAQVDPKLIAHQNLLPGEKMREEGGVRQKLDISLLDVKATPMGEYDSALVDAIASAWYGLLDAQQYAFDYRGKVAVQFHLYADGRISDLKVTENSTTGDRPAMLCQMAIDHSSPFLPFPSDLRTTVPNPRSIQFTFYYNW